MTLLRSIHSPSTNNQSESESKLIELLGCSFVRLGEEGNEKLSVRLMDPAQEGYGRCDRCRKMNNHRRKDRVAEGLCERCERAEMEEEDTKTRRKAEAKSLGTIC